MMLCPSCGEEVNPSRFCPDCGAPLGSINPSLQEERKVVSILFVDLAGFTARSHASDPEDVRAALAPYHALLKKEIERFGGTVEKFIGDAVMAVFGAPIAHEDDAERAVRAALRIAEELIALNERSPGLDLSIRAAVNTGEGLVILGARPQAGEGMVTGDVVNTASRLQNAAAVGAVVVGETTYRTTKVVIDYEELPPVTVKGKPAPISVWRALAAKSRFGVDAEMHSSTPFIGRDYELDVLKGTFVRTLTGPSVQLVTIVGEPGVGKTRLLSEFAAFVDEQKELVWWRQGRSLPYGEGITFWALGEVIKAHAGILESDTPALASDKLRHVVDSSIENETERQWFHARLASLVGAGTPAGAVERDESFTAWRRFLEALALKGPLVIVLEDLHWADGAMLDFVEHLVDWATGVPLMVVCTARPELYESNPGWGGGKRNSNTISLPPLSDVDTARLISSLLDQALLPAEIQSALLERAGGNPLYAEEFIRMLGDKGILRQKGALLAFDGDAEIALPETVQAVIAARLDTLPPERKALLHDASIVGKVFWSGAVGAIGGSDDGTLRQGLHDLLRKEIVRPAHSSSMEGQEEYSFWHGLIRDVSYSQIPRAGRALKHEALARWLEDLVGDRAADQADILAYHYGQALELSRASGLTEDAQRLKEPTRRFLVLAGDRAQNLDVQRAKTYYLEALALFASDDPERADALLKLGDAEDMAGEAREAEHHLEEAIAVFFAVGKAEAAAQAMLTLSASVGNRGDNRACIELEDRAIALLEAQPATSLLPRAYAARSVSLTTMGEPHQALGWAEKVIAMCEPSGISRMLAKARIARAMALSALSDPRAKQEFEAALQMSLDLDIGEYVAWIYEGLAGVAQFHEGPAKALEFSETQLDFAQGRGLLFLAITAKQQMATMIYVMGRWKESLILADDVIGWAKTNEMPSLLVLPYALKIQVLLSWGRFSEATALSGELLPIAREIGQPQFLAAALGAAALALHRGTDGAAALALVKEFSTLTEGHNAVWRLAYLLDAVRVLLGMGHVEEAQDLTRGLEPRSKHAYINFDNALALIAEAKEEFQEAATLFESSAEKWRDFGVPYEEGQALLGLGRCLSFLGRTQEASLPLLAAKEIFAELSAEGLLLEAEERLAAQEGG
jgi:class 3 adenylate cyclase/tetratricopeptide (TPR) repeat protein